jgi:serine phosphatase RsbU (regulator of sigma subunit)
LFALVFKRGFVGLTLACVTFAVAPAFAKEHGGGPPPHAGGPHGTPPGQEAAAARSDADPPPPADEPVEPEPEQQVAGRFVQPERLAPQPRARGELVPGARTLRKSIGAPRSAESPKPAPVAAAASSPAPKRAARAEETLSHAEETLSDAVVPSQLPARVVSAQVRRIVEVVPAEAWAALAGLALLTLALAGSSWATARKARRLSRQRDALRQEVGVLQAALLPSVPDGAPVSVAYRPANGASAGGDFYDVFELPGDRSGLILGDVSGRGREALARTTFIRYTLRAYLEAGLEPREVLKVGSDALADHLDGGFATAIVAMYERATGRFTYASAGHPPPLVTGCTQPYRPVTACSAPPLGIGEATGFRQSTFPLTVGARACLYTDGVTEARVGGGMLGVVWLTRALEELPPAADADFVLDAIAGMADEMSDDMALCLVTAAADAPAAGPRIEELEVDGHEAGDSLERFLRACGVPLGEVPGILREAGEVARREGSATVRVRSGDFRPGVDVVPGNLVRLAERQHAVR